MPKKNCQKGEIGIKFNVIDEMLLDGIPFYVVAEPHAPRAHSTLLKVGPNITKRPKRVSCLINKEDWIGEETLSLHPLFMVRGVYFMKVVHSTKTVKGFNVHLEDQYGALREATCPVRPPEGEVIKVRVANIEKHFMELQIILESDTYGSEIQRAMSASPASTRHIATLQNETQGLGYHRCGKDFICSLCGEYVESGKGYRVNLKDIYLCPYCWRLVFPKTGKGWKGLIISTPM